MALPFSPNTAYVAGNLPAVHAQDLNDLQTYLSGLYSATYSIPGMVIDGIGGVAKSTRAATSALLRAEDGNGKARSLTDYLGFRTGPVVEVTDTFLGLQALLGVQAGAFAGSVGGWYTYGTANSGVIYNSAIGPSKGCQGGTGVAIYMSGSSVATDYVTLYNQGVYDSYSTASGAYAALDQTVTVFEWAMGHPTTYVSGDWFVGILGGTGGNNSSTNNPILSTATIKAGLRYAPGARSDTSIVCVTEDGATETNTPTSIMPSTNGFPLRCRMEIHRSGTPFGACVRFFINGTLFTSTTHLPIQATASLPCMFKVTLAASTASTTVYLNLHHWRMLAMPYGSLAAGALSSDV